MAMAWYQEAASHVQRFVFAVERGERTWEGSLGGNVLDMAPNFVVRGTIYLAAA